MSFEEDLRAKISAAPFQSTERQLLKTVLGDFRRGKSQSDEAGIGLITKMIKANEDSLKRMHAEDSRREEYLEENRVLKSLLK